MCVICESDDRQRTMGVRWALLRSSVVAITMIIYGGNGKDVVEGRNNIFADSEHKCRLKVGCS